MSPVQIDRIHKILKTHSYFFILFCDFNINQKVKHLDMLQQCLGVLFGIHLCENILLPFSLPNC